MIAILENLLFLMLALFEVCVVVVLVVCVVILGKLLIHVIKQRLGDET